MKLAIVCNDNQKEEFLSIAVPAELTLFFTGSLIDIPADADVLFDLLFDGSKERSGRLKTFLPRPVFINAVILTLSDIQEPFIRINAWPGFLKRNITEITALPAQEAHVKEVLGWLNRQYKLVPDWPGMVSARVIASIINEAWFTFGDGVSTREEIDIAMKAGTNYPYGPFEWADRIGMEQIIELLNKLSSTDKRYQPAPALMAAAGR